VKCAGRYLRGSSVEDGLIETEVFGKLTLTSVLEGSHYVFHYRVVSNHIGEDLDLLSWTLS
jgi:hypothetical protein